MELAAPVALRRVEPGMRAALVCSVEALVNRRVRDCGIGSVSNDFVAHRPFNSIGGGAQLSAD